MPVDLSSSKDKDLKAMYEAYQNQLGSFVRANQPFWSKKLGIRNGTLSNLEAGLAYMATLGNSSLSGGCVSLQGETERVLLAVGASGWTVEPIRVGSLAVGHSAVAVYPKGGAMSQGYVFDAWLRQDPLVFTHEEWCGHFRAMAIMGKPRSQ